VKSRNHTLDLVCNTDNFFLQQSTLEVLILIPLCLQTVELPVLSFEIADLNIKPPSQKVLPLAGLKELIRIDSDRSYTLLGSRVIVLVTSFVHFYLVVWLLIRRDRLVIFFKVEISFKTFI